MAPCGIVAGSAHAVCDSRGTIRGHGGDCSVIETLATMVPDTFGDSWTIGNADELIG